MDKYDKLVSGINRDCVLGVAEAQDHIKQLRVRMDIDPDGEIDMDALEWLSKNDRPFFEIVSRAVLKNNFANEQRTGKAFTSFDLQREIIEETDKRRSKGVSNAVDTRSFRSDESQ